MAEGRNEVAADSLLLFCGQEEARVGDEFELVDSAGWLEVRQDLSRLLAEDLDLLAVCGDDVVLAEAIGVKRSKV